MRWRSSYINQEKWGGSMEDDMIQQTLEKAMSKTSVKQNKKKAKKSNPKLWERLFLDNLKKDGYIK